ncbi:MAG: HAD family hydrolase [Thermoanaerobaculia bacterium]
MKAVLFDMGGVLLNFLGDPGIPTGQRDFRGREVLLHFLNDRGANLSEEDLERELFGPWRRESERRNELGREADWAPHFRRLRKRAGGLRTPSLTLLKLWYRPLAEKVEPLPGAREVLEDLTRAGKRLALVSNTPLPGKFYVPILERHGLAGFLERMYFSYDQGHRKPSPALIRRALADLGVAAGDAVMVGDRRSIDVVAGRSAGVATIWLRSHDGGGPAADHVVDDLRSILALV